MQKLNDNVTIFVTQRELPPRAAEPNGTNASTAALQYIIENLGFDTVTLRVDFSESTNIKLRHFAKPRSTNTLQDAASHNLFFDCEIHPFERQTLAYVIKNEKKRALVRVHYVVKEVVTPSVDAIVIAREKAAHCILQQLQHSDDVFNHVSNWKAVPSQPQDIIAQVCDEINRFFRLGGDVFVDATFAPQAKSLYDSELEFTLSEADCSIYTLCSFEHLHNIADSSWTFVNQPHVVLSPDTFTSGLPAQDSFLSALTLLAPHCEMWLHRWFPTLDASSQIGKMAAIPVALCDRGLTWQHFFVDLFFPSYPLGRGLLASRNVHGELYPALLHKAYAKLKGSYDAISGIPTMTVLQELTGSPWVCCYRRSISNDYADPSNGQVQLQEAVQAALCCRRPISKKDIFLVVVTCGKVDNHRGAFRLTPPRDKDLRFTSVILHDVYKKLLHHLDPLKLNHEPDSSTNLVSWEQLFELEPFVWSLSLDQQHEQRLRQIFLHDNEIVNMTAVISVSALTTIVFSLSYLAHFPPESCDRQVELDISIARAKNDFSLTPIENIRMSFQDISYEHDRVLRKQVVRSLSAGEYLVAVTAKRLTCSDSSSEAENLDLASAETVLTPVSVDTNLQLVFDCLDFEAKRELSKSDICTFLQLYEHITLSQHVKKDISPFLEQFGRPGSKGRGLTFDDFQNIYLGLAAQSYHTDSSDNSTSSKSKPSTRNCAQFQEFIWHDLVCLLSSSKRGVQADYKAEKIACRDIVELLCTFHSNTPLLKVVLLPKDKSFPDLNM